MSEASTIESVRAHAREGRSGEFICASPTVEVHIFLQRGRVAWATDSIHPFVFAQHLKAQCKIDDEAFSHVLDACRRDRLPLGETLVAWGLAAWSDVLAALRHQMRLALETLQATAPDASSTIFLERRRFGEYNERLTFDLGELVASCSEAPPSSTPAPASVDGTRESAHAPPSAARSVLSGVRGATWVQILEDGRVVDVAAKGGETVPAVSRELARATLEDGADYVALRSPDGSLLGGRIDASPRQLWCALNANANYGAAFAALSQLITTGGRRHKAAGRAKASIGWHAGDVAHVWGSELKQVFDYSGNVVAVGVVDSAGCVVTGMGTVDFDLAAFEAIVSRRQAAIVGGGGHVAGAQGKLEALGFRYQTIVTGEPSVWCFGSESFTGHDSSTLWLLVRREASQGVGWACLSAVSRMIATPRSPS